MGSLSGPWTPPRPSQAGLRRAAPPGSLTLCLLHSSTWNTHSSKRAGHFPNSASEEAVCLSPITLRFPRSAAVRNCPRSYHLPECPVGEETGGQALAFPPGSASCFRRRGGTSLPRDPDTSPSLPAPSRKWRLPSFSLEQRYEKGFGGTGFPVYQNSCVLSPSVVSDSSVTPCTVASQAPGSMGFSRKEHWSGLPFPPPEDLPRDRTCIY